MLESSRYDLKQQGRLRVKCVEAVWTTIMNVVIATSKDVLSGSVMVGHVVPL